MKTNLSTKKIALAGVFTALAVVGSFISFPVAGSKCAPVQHMVNILAAVTLGPFWGIGIAFIASLLRNLLALGSLMAFPGSMVGALCCGLVYHFSHKLSLTCAAEALGTGILGGIAAYPVAVYLMGLTPAGIFVYVVPFLISTVAGSILAFLLITVLEKVPVGRDQKLLLVKLGEEYYFLGAGPSGITCLGQVPKQTVEEWEKAKKDQPSPMSFRQSLEQVIKQRKDKGGH